LYRNGPQKNFKFTQQNVLDKKCFLIVMSFYLFIAILLVKIARVTRALGGTLANNLAARDVRVREVPKGLPRSKGH
jgi:hypothetical protein